MRKIKTFILALSLACATGVGAQNEITVANDSLGKEEVIDLPEGMTLDADSLLKQWNAQKYLVRDTTCENPDFNPTFEEKVFIDRLRRIPSAIELPHNAVVQKFIDQYSGRLRKSVSYMLGACNLYVPTFEEALDYYGLPLELKYLPVIESALDPTAVSRVGAVGLWQFMLPTARRYELDINSLVDERRDPIKSSYAAAHYLSDLYKIFGDWNLVIAAYNCGPNNVNKAIHRADGQRDYWTIYPYLPKETRGYVPAFIAANYIMNYYCEHNICPMKTSKPLSTDTIMVSRDVHFEQIAALCGTDIETLKALNPQYKRNIVPGYSRPYSIRMPIEAINKFIDLKDSVYNYRADELLTRRSVVGVDESAAPAVRTSSDNSERSSRVSSSRSRRSSSYRSRSRKRKKTTRRKTTSVRKGDTLSEIAERHNTTVSKLRKLNKIRGNKIKPGQKIRVK